MAVRQILGIPFFPFSFGLGTGRAGYCEKRKREKRHSKEMGWLVGWLVGRLVGLGWVDFWRLDFCFIFSSQSWFHFFWVSNALEADKKKFPIFWEGFILFFNISSGGPFDLPVQSSLCTFWNMGFCFSLCILYRLFPARVISILWCIILATFLLRVQKG